jgi:putative N-acetyltransferase (TIGR04045 family)
MKTEPSATPMLRNVGRPHSPTMTVRCSIVDSPTKAGHHHRIRSEVFVAEQAIFTGDDLDEHDGEPATIKVLAYCGDAPAGTVRLFPTSRDSTEWQGDRLAVLAPFRHNRVGAPLVDFAVRTAAQFGGHRMTAHIQVPNVRFFETLGWLRCGPIDVRRRSATLGTKETGA